MTLGGHIVTYDERQKWKWNTHYRDQYIPPSRETSDYAGGSSGYSRADLMKRPIDERRKALREEYYGHQFSFTHTPGASPLEGKNSYKLPYSKTSELIGAMATEKELALPEYYDDAYDDSDEEDAAADDVQRRRLGLSTPNNPAIYSGANNCRNAWYRNVSQIGEAVWGLEYERPGVPVSTKKADPSQYLYSAHPGYAPLANTHHFHPSNPGYTTTKAAVDHDTVGQSMAENLYTQFGQAVQGQGFQVQKKTRDGTIVSADTPAWFQIPGVTVNKLSQSQLTGLVQWKAPIPKKHTDQKLLNGFFGEEVNPQPACVPAECERDSADDDHIRQLMSRPKTHHSRTRPKKDPTAFSDVGSDISVKLPPRPPTSHHAGRPPRDRPMEEDDGLWSPPCNSSRPATSHSSRASSLSRANLERHNMTHSRGGASAALLAQAQTTRLSGHRPGTVGGKRLAHMAEPSEASMSIARSVRSAGSMGSNASRRTGSLYGQVDPMRTNYGHQGLARPGSSPGMSAADLVTALKSAAKGDSGAPPSVIPSRRGRGYPASMTSRSSMASSSTIQQAAARELLKMRMNQQASRPVTANA